MSALLAGIWPKLIAAGLAVLALFGLGMGVRRSGKDAERAAQAEDTLKRQEAGTVAGNKAKSDLRQGKSPEDVVSGNDGAWK